MKRAYVEIRRQHARGTWPAQGPDTYVAVQVVPEGVERLKVLNRRVAADRGIEIHHFGEGYSMRQATTRSMLGRAKMEAETFAAAVNESGHSM